MVQRRGGLRLLREPAEPIRIGGEAAGSTLTATSRPSARVARPIHLAHPAGAERRENLASTKSVASSETHRAGEYTYNQSPHHMSWVRRPATFAEIRDRCFSSRFP